MPFAALLTLIAKYAMEAFLDFYLSDEAGTKALGVIYLSFVAVYTSTIFSSDDQRGHTRRLSEPSNASVQPSLFDHSIIPALRAQLEEQKKKTAAAEKSAKDYRESWGKVSWDCEETKEGWTEALREHIDVSILTSRDGHRPADALRSVLTSSPPPKRRSTRCRKRQRRPRASS